MDGPVVETTPGHDAQRDGDVWILWSRTRVPEDDGTEAAAETLFWPSPIV